MLEKIIYKKHLAEFPEIVLHRWYPSSPIVTILITITILHVEKLRLKGAKFSNVKQFQSTRVRI